MKPVTRCLVGIAATLLVACASNPPPAPAAVADGASVPANFKIPSGYRQVRLNGVEKFCRKNIPTGMRVSNGEVCLTAAQLQAEQEQSASALQGMQRAGANKSSCSSGPM